MNKYDVSYIVIITISGRDFMHISSEIMYHRDGAGNLISVTDTATGEVIKSSVHVATNTVSISDVFLFIGMLGAVGLLAFMVYQLESN